MKAQTVAHETREPINAHFYYGHGGRDGDTIRAHVPGQLWSRLADASLNQDALTAEQWHRMASKRNQLGTHAQRTTADIPLRDYGRRMMDDDHDCSRFYSSRMNAGSPNMHRVRSAID
jgi:hypothetical protein